MTKKAKFFTVVLFFFITIFILAQEEGKIGIRYTEAVVVPPGPDYALMKDISEKGGQRAVKTDGKANPGETLFLDIRIENSTDSYAQGLRAELRSDDRRIGRQIYLEKREAIVGDLAAGASTTLTATGASAELLSPAGLTGAFRFSLGERCPPEPIIFNIAFKDSLGKEWAETLLIQVDPLENADSLSLGGFSFFTTTKIIEDGSILAFGIDWEYSRALSGGLEFSQTKTGYNEEWANDSLVNIENSLVAVESKSYDFIIQPIAYDLVRKPASRLWFGAGAYYSYMHTKEEGYFDHPLLQDLGYEHLNYIDNDYKTHLLGPLLGIGFTYRGSDWFKSSLAGNILPIYARWGGIRSCMLPLVTSPDVLNYNFTKAGGPNLYGDLSGIISIPQMGAFFKGNGFSPSNWKLWFSFLADYVRYKSVYTSTEQTDPNPLFYHTTAEGIFTGHSLSVEGALLVPIGGIYIQVGGGWIFSTSYLDNELMSRQAKNYINVSGKMLKF